MKVRFTKTSPEAVTPSYGTAGAAAFDLCCLADGDTTIPAGATVLLHTGICVEIPEGYVGLLFARSGLATKRGLAPANCVGVIDSDYRGEVMIPMHNHSAEPQVIAPRERVAQMSIVPFLAAELEECEELSDTDRGAGGFGSTGRM